MQALLCPFKYCMKQLYILYCPNIEGQIFCDFTTAVIYMTAWKKYLTSESP